MTDWGLKMVIAISDLCQISLIAIIFSYVLADDMEFPLDKKLPLWVLGFLY